MDKTVHKNKKFGTEIRKKGNAGVEEWVGDWELIKPGLTNCYAIL
jgi:hypothetical protein